MESLIDTFHIDVKLLIAQAVNFGIVIGVLYYFAMKPLTKILSERGAKIEKSLADAAAVDEKLKATDTATKAILASAKKDAAAIITDAQARAEERRFELINKAKEDIGQIINAEKEKMQIEKAQSLKELKAEVASLVVAGIEKVLGEKMDESVNKDFVKKILK